MTGHANSRRPLLADACDLIAAASLPGRFEICEVQFAAQVDLRVDPAGLEAKAIAAALGIALPVEPNTVATADGRDVLWLGPDEWLVVGPDGSAGGIEALLRGAIGAGFGAVVDVSAGRAVLEVAGPAARDVLATCCSIDLHPRAFGPGQCAQTLLRKAQVILQQVDDRPGYRLFVRPSFGAYVVGWLAEGVREVGVGG